VLFYFSKRGEEEEEWNVEDEERKRGLIESLNILLMAFVSQTDRGVCLNEDGEKSTRLCSLRVWR